MATEKTYSKTQIILHWTIVLLVLIQYVANDSISALWRDRMTGAIANTPVPDIHVAFGIAIFVLMIWRIWLVFTNAAPALPANEPRALQILARSVQGLIYLSLFALPLSGSAAWFFGIQPAILVHEIVKLVLLLLIFVHVVGALYQHFWLKSDVLMKMLGRG